MLPLMCVLFLHHVVSPLPSLYPSLAFSLVKGFGGAVCLWCVSPFQMNNQNCNILNWNIRGLNNPARRKVVSDLIKDTRSSVASIQETKLAAVNNQIVAETLGCLPSSCWNLWRSLAGRGCKQLQNSAVSEQTLSQQRSEL